MTVSENTIYTIGHSNLRLDRFMDMLKEAGITTVVDVRSQPYSKYCPYFNKRELDRALTEAGFRYLFQGNMLGGIPDDDSFYDEEGHVMYEKVASTRAFQEAAAYVAQLAGEQPLTLMCGEENPGGCHRHRLLGPAFAELGLEMIHIRKDGILIKDSELDSEQSIEEEPEEARVETRQLSIFETI
ncbi:MAG: DUF488 domain-containing protein [Candidatus Obscuribacterales bacterium]|nr:DUF488 domain-containing protein [Candidatus Obscuribacterales bacterium]